MEKGKLKWGIIGAGIIAEKMADTLRQNRDSELIAVASKSAERGAIFAGYNNVPLSCSSDEIVGNSAIDVIDVATTHNSLFSIDVPLFSERIIFGPLVIIVVRQRPFGIL